MCGGFSTFLCPPLPPKALYLLYRTWTPILLLAIIMQNLFRWKILYRKYEFSVSAHLIADFFSLNTWYNQIWTYIFSLNMPSTFIERWYVRENFSETRDLFFLAFLKLIIYIFFLISLYTPKFSYHHVTCYYYPDCLCSSFPVLHSLLHPCWML